MRWAIVALAVSVAVAHGQSDGAAPDGAAAPPRRLKTIALTSTFREKLHKAHERKADEWEALQKKLKAKALPHTVCTSKNCDQAHPISGKALQKLFGHLGERAWQMWVDGVPLVREAADAKSKADNARDELKRDATAVEDCIVSPFGPYSACSQPCDTGFALSARTVLVHPANGGKACPSHLTLRQPCNTSPCASLSQRAQVEHKREATLRAMELRIMYKKYHEKVQIDCAVGHWGPYAACSAPCGGGVKERRRQVIRVPLFQGRMCPTLAQTKPCNPMPCTAAQASGIKTAAEKKLKAAALSAQVTKVARERLIKRMTRGQQALAAAENKVKHTAAPTTAPTAPPTPVPTPAPTPYGRTMAQDYPSNWATMEQYQRSAWMTRWRVVHQVPRTHFDAPQLAAPINGRLTVQQLMVCRNLKAAPWCPRGKSALEKAIAAKLAQMRHAEASSRPVFSGRVTKSPTAQQQQQQQQQQQALPKWACASLAKRGTCVCPNGAIVLQAPSGAQSEPFLLGGSGGSGGNPRRRLFFGSSSTEKTGSLEQKQQHAAPPAAAAAASAAAAARSMTCSLDAFDDPTDGAQPPSRLFCRCCEPHGKGAHALEQGTCVALVPQGSRGLDAPATTTATTTTTTTTATTTTAAPVAADDDTSSGGGASPAKKSHGDLPKWACAAEGGMCLCSGHVLMGTGTVWLPPVPTRTKVKCGDKRHFGASPAPGSKLYCMCKTLCKAKGSWVPCSTPPPHVKTEKERKADDAQEKAQKILVLRTKIAAAKVKRLHAAEHKQKHDALHKVTAEHRAKKVASRGGAGAHLALSAAEALRYPGAFDDDWASDKAEGLSPAMAAAAAAAAALPSDGLPPCAQGDADNLDDIEPTLCPDGQVKSFANDAADEKVVEDAWEREESHEEEKLVDVNEPVVWAPLKEPILRDTSCPSAFTPRHFAQHLPVEAKQGCCLLDKVLGAVELLWHVRKCQHWHEHVRDPAAVDTARAAGVLLPCEANAVAMFSRDLHSCCCDLPGEGGKTVSSSSGDQCKHAQSCYYDGDDTGMWHALAGLQDHYDKCAQWHVDKGKGLALKEVGANAHVIAKGHCQRLKKGIVTVTKNILALSKALYKKVPEALTEAAGNLLKLCNGKMWFGRYVLLLFASAASLRR